MSGTDTRRRAKTHYGVAYEESDYFRFVCKGRAAASGRAVCIVSERRGRDAHALPKHNPIPQMKRFPVVKVLFCSNQVFLRK